tara:strand:- start:1909 stop:2187 length:279 start_codon:yes stop_codon:yes gene_type:complete
MDRKVIRVLKESISKLDKLKSLGEYDITLVRLNLEQLVRQLDNKMLLKTTIVQPVYGYWRDDSENREYVLDREEMQREFNDKLNQLEEEGLL